MIIQFKKNLKAWLAGIFVVLIGFVFVFYGVFSPKATRGIHGTAVAGKVNGEAIFIKEFYRDLNQRIEFFKQLGLKELSDVDQVYLRKQVFQAIVRKKLLLQEAKKRKLFVSNSQLLQSIEKIPGFQVDGKFDFSTYKHVLEVNRYYPSTPPRFEKWMKENFLMSQWEEYWGKRVLVSSKEVEKEYGLEKNCRNIKYVFLKLQSKDLSEKMNQLANQMIPLFHSSQDQALNDFLKREKLDTVVRQTGMVSAKRNHLAGVGNAVELFKDAFHESSPISLPKKGKAKCYPVVHGIVVGAVIAEQNPDLKKFAEEKMQWVKRIKNEKIAELQKNLINQRMQKAKIEVNHAVIEGKN